MIEISRLGMVVGLAILAWRIGHRRFTAVPWTLAGAVVLLIVVSGLSLALTRWPNGIRIEAAMAIYALVALFVAQTVRDERGLRVVAGAFIASGAMVAVILVLEAVFDFYLWREGGQGVLGRRNGTFADPNITSRFLALAFLAVLAALAAWRGPRRWAVAGILLAALAFGVGQALTQSRAGWLTAVVSIVLWLAFARTRRRAILPVVMLTLGFAGAVLADPTALLRASSTVDDVGNTIGGIVGQPGPSATAGSGPTSAPGSPGATGSRGTTGSPGASPRPSSPTPTSAPVQPVSPAVPDTGPALGIDPFLDHVPLDSVRRYLLRAGVAMFADRPLTGVGLGGFQPEIEGAYRAFIPAERRVQAATLPHSELARIAAETGLVGLAVLAVLILAIAGVLWSVRRARAPVVIAAGAVGLGMLSILIASQFEGRLVDEPYLWLLIGLAAALPSVAAAAGDARPFER